MDVTFLTPLAGLVALLVALPLAVMLLTERRVCRGARARCGCPSRGPRGRWPRSRSSSSPRCSGSERRSRRSTRTEDRLARGRRRGVRRLRHLALDARLRGAQARTRGSRALRPPRCACAASCPRSRSGLASLTDRVLPHLLATTNQAAFEATVRRTLGVDRPPPLQRANRVASTFDALRVRPDSQLLRARREEAPRRLPHGRREPRLQPAPDARRLPHRRHGAGASCTSGRRASASSVPTARPSRSYQADPRATSRCATLAAPSTAAGRSTRTSWTPPPTSSREFIGEGEAKPLGENSIAYEPRAVPLPLGVPAARLPALAAELPSRRRRAPRRRARRPRRASWTRVTRSPRYSLASTTVTTG